MWKEYVKQSFISKVSIHHNAMHPSTSQERKMEKIAIIGAGGFGREVLDIIDACNQIKPIYKPLGFIVDPIYAKPGEIVNDLPILGGFDWLEQHAGDVFITCGVGPSHLRYQLIQRAKAINTRFINLIHPSVIKTRWISMGEGVIITAGCILTNQIMIGDHVHLNLDCTIGHNSVLQDFVTLAPGVHVSGNVQLETGCYIGTGANIIEKLVIGEWSIIGAGSTIINNVPPNTTVVGNPGKIIKERIPGWHLQS
jgi:sugar O-acyltransferase (sialic acid O-acetyltransferase NeuD family)